MDPLIIEVAINGGTPNRATLMFLFLRMKLLPTR